MQARRAAKFAARVAGHIVAGSTLVIGLLAVVLPFALNEPHCFPRQPRLLLWGALLAGLSALALRQVHRWKV